MVTFRAWLFSSFQKDGARAAGDAHHERATFPKPARVFLRSGWGALFFFVLMTAAFTWPLVLHLGDSLPNWGDAADNAWRMGSIAHQMQTDPLHLYRTRSLYPVDNVLALDELLTAQCFLGAPIIWLTGNIPLALNLVTYLSFVLSGMAMWLLVHHLTGSKVAGLLAGMIFAFCPLHQEQYPNLGLAAWQWMVFALYFLALYLQDTARKRQFLARRNIVRLAMFALLFAFQALAAGYYSYLEAILIGIYLCYHFIFTSGVAHVLWAKLTRKPAITNGWHVPALQFAAVALAGAVSLAVMLPFVYPFVKAQNQYQFQRSLKEVQYWSDDLVNLTVTGRRSWLHDPLRATIPNRKAPIQQVLYPGASALLLAVMGVVGARKLSRRRNETIPPWLFGMIGLLGLVLSLGPVLKVNNTPTSISLPYGFLYNSVPGFDALRVPHRFGLLFMLGISVCAGYGIAALQNRLSRSVLGEENSGRTDWLAALPAIMLALVLVVEYFAPGMPYEHTGVLTDAPALYKWLASPDSARVVSHNDLLLEVPMSEMNTPVNTGPIYLLYGLYHDRPMLNGSANIVPPGYDRLFYAMRRFPSPDTLDTAQALGVKFIIVHTREFALAKKQEVLARLAGPGGRLEMVNEFPDYTGDPRFKDIIYRLKPDAARFANMAKAIPLDSPVLLTAETTHNRRIYTNMLPALIGRGRRYFSEYQTVYDTLVGDIKPAHKGVSYRFLITYKGQDPRALGFSSADLLPGAGNETVDVYGKK